MRTATDAVAVNAEGIQRPYGDAMHLAALDVSSLGIQNAQNLDEMGFVFDGIPRGNDHGEQPGQEGAIPVTQQESSGVGKQRAPRKKAKEWYCVSPPFFSSFFSLKQGNARTHPAENKRDISDTLHLTSQILP